MRLSLQVVLTLSLMSSTVYAEADDGRLGRWSPVFNWSIIPIHASVLPNGKVFTWGTNSVGERGSEFNFEIWNPKGGLNDHELLPNSTNVDTFCAGTSLLTTGELIIAGGDVKPLDDPDGKSSGINSTNVYDPGSNALQVKQPMNFARWYPSVITLPNGESLIQGGRDGPEEPIGVPEVFSSTDSRPLWNAVVPEFTQANNWFYPRIWVAPNGKIFGVAGELMYYLDWTGNEATNILGKFPRRSAFHSSSAVMYRPGKILQTGGSIGPNIKRADGSRGAVTIDINGEAPVITPLPNMAYKRVWGNATVLPNGEVFVSGGSARYNKLDELALVAEMWNPDTGKFRTLRAAANPRLYHSTALLLQDGSVLTAGGGAPGPIEQFNGEVYYPPYLFKDDGTFARRPVIGGFNQNMKYGAKRKVPFSNSKSISRVTFVRLGSVTHSFDTGQRFMELAFKQVGESLEIEFPSRAELAPPGYYHMFIINQAGVPSVSKIVSLQAAPLPLD